MGGNENADWELVGIEPEYLEKVWAVVHPWLKNVEEYSGGRLTLETLVDRLADGKMQLWVVKGERPVAAVVTEVTEYPNIKYCLIVLASGGNAKSWVRPVIDELERWAKHNGCNATELLGRRAWLKLLPEYKIERYLLVKELQDG